LSGTEVTHLPVNLELIVEDFITDLIDRIGLVTIILPASVHWAPLAIPDAEATLIHPFTFLLVTPPQTMLLFRGACVGLRGARKTKKRIIMNGVSGVIPTLVRITKVRKIGRKSVTIKENDMICILSTDNGVKLVVELHNASTLGIGGFVKRIIASNPLVTPVVLS